MSPYSGFVVQNEMSYNMIQYCLNCSRSLSSGVFLNECSRNIKVSLLLSRRGSCHDRQKHFRMVLLLVQSHSVQCVVLQELQPLPPVAAKQ